MKGCVLESILSILLMVLAVAFFVWLVIIVPINMARNRDRSPVIWVLVSIFLSPLVAIGLLLVLGDAT